jgi:hypothetical protein
MAGFLFKLEMPDGAPAEPSSLSSAVPNWGPGETIHVGHRTLRVVAVRDDDADSPPVLVVEDLAASVTRVRRVGFLCSARPPGQEDGPDGPWTGERQVWEPLTSGADAVALGGKTPKQVSVLANCGLG